MISRTAIYLAQESMTRITVRLKTMLCLTRLGRAIDKILSQKRQEAKLGQGLMTLLSDLGKMGRVLLYKVNRLTKLVTMCQALANMTRITIK